MQETLERVIFRTDPRVLARAKLKGEANLAEDQAKLTAAVDLIWQTAHKGIEPEAGWLREAKSISNRVGAHWCGPGGRSGQKTPEEVVGDMRKAEHEAHEAIESHRQAESARSVRQTECDLPDPARLLIRPSPVNIVDTFLPMPTLYLESFGSATTSLCIEAAFKARRFVIASPIANLVMIDACLVGRDHQWGGGSIHGSVFSPFVFPLPLSFKTAHPGAVISVTVTNLEDAPLEFSGVFYGRELRQ